MPTSLHRQARNALAVLAAATVLATPVSPVLAQSPIRLIVPTQAGSQADAWHAP